MKPYTYSLNVAASGLGTISEDLTNIIDKWIQVTGIAGGAVIRLDGSADNGVTYSVLPIYVAGAAATTMSADGWAEVPANCKYLKVNRTVAGTGTPVVTLMGRHGRWD